MRSFIHRKNVELYRRRLRDSTDPAEREVLAKLLAEEEATGAKTGRRPADEGLTQIKSGD